jgi:hypothetical protein
MKRYLVLLCLLLLNLDYTKEYVIKERRDVIQFWTKSIVEDYFVIEKFQSNRFETLPIVVDDYVIKLEVEFIYNGFNTYRVLFNYQFYEITSAGLVKTMKVSHKVWNLITAIDRDMKTKFFSQIIYDW